MLKPFNYKGFRALMECHRLTSGVRQPDKITNGRGYERKTDRTAIGKSCKGSRRNVPQAGKPRNGWDA